MFATERYENYAAHYARTARLAPARDAAAVRDGLHRREWLPIDRNARILDVGCGWGGLLLSLWNAGYRHLEGVDGSPEQVAQCVGRVKGKFAIHCQDGREFLAARRGRYDLIIMISVIEHIPPAEVVAFLKEARLALVPGGRLVLFAPNMANLTSMWIQFSDLTHTTAFTEFSIQQALDQAGFEAHQIVRQNARDLSQWSIARPWRGLGLGQWANDLLHRSVYRITGQFPRPSCFAANLEVYSHRPDPSHLRRARL